jgi:hypothetical protein
MKDHYEEIHKLVREDYGYEFVALQELIAEMVIKTQKYNKLDVKERYNKIISLLLGQPRKKIEKKGSKDDRDDLGRIAALCKEKGLSIGEAAAEVARQHYIKGYKIGDGFPKEISHYDRAEILSHAKRVTTKIQENEIDLHDQQFKERLKEEIEMLSNIERDVSLAKSLFSEWLERYHSQ